MADIRYIKGSEIDRYRWDRALFEAPNGNLFGSSVFLDTMTDGWDAVICGDYDAMLPLPVRSKWGIRYVHTIPFCGPFSIFGHGALEAGAEAMLGAIPHNIVRCDINLWTGNAELTGWTSTSRVNHMLDLSEAYPVIRSRYHASTKNLLNRAMDAGFQLVSTLPVSTQIIMAEKFGGTGHSVRRELIRFDRLCQRWAEVGEVFSLVVSSTDGLPLSGGVFLRDAHRIHYLLGWSSREGRRQNASRFLIDHIIQLHAGHLLTLDFEGSDIPGVAQFFSSFGAVPKHYQLLRRDILPMPLRSIITLRDRWRPVLPRR
jgi:hypothetical protein